MADAERVNVNDAGDILYVRLSDAAIHTTREFGDYRMVDYDSQGHVVGVEFLQIAGGIDMDGLPENRRLQTVLLAHGFGGKINTVDHIDTLKVFTLDNIYPTVRGSTLIADGLIGVSGPDVDRSATKPDAYRYVDGVLKRLS